MGTSPLYSAHAGASLRTYLGNLTLHPIVWYWALLACFGTAGGLALAHYWLHAPPPLALTVREDAGQLLINWNPQAALRRSRLEITDGDGHTTVYVSSKLMNLTYKPRTSDVEVRLTDLKSNETRQVARIVNPAQSVSLDGMRIQMTQLEAEARSVGTSIDQGHRRVEALQKQANRLLRVRKRTVVRRVSRPSRQPPRVQVVSWWR